MEATPQNMRQLETEAGEPISVPGVFAYSPNTGERYSATSGDYFSQPPDEPLRDENGDPMILAREVCEIVPVD